MSAAPAADDFMASPRCRCPALNVTIRRATDSALIPPCSWANLTSVSVHKEDGSCCRGGRHHDDADGLELRHEAVLHGFHSRQVMWSRCYPLSASDFERSLTVRGGTRLPGVIRRLAAGGNATVAVIGGSTCMGTGARFGVGNRLGTPSTRLFVNWLRHRYPFASIDFHMLALPGTTSQARVSGLGLQDLEALSADLVIWDYASNDYGAYAADPLGYRSVMERLVRAVHTLPSRPALILLALLSTGFDDPRNVWSLQDDAILPVAQQYRVTLVSYRDAVYPEFGRPRHELVHAPNLEGYHAFGVYTGNEDNRAHLKQSTHVLVGDVLAHAWASIESGLRVQAPHDARNVSAAATAAAATDLDDEGFPAAPVFPFEDRLSSEAADSATACPVSGWKTQLVNAELRRGGMTSSSNDVGWIFNDSLPQKQGWQFSMERSRRYLHRSTSSVPAAHSSPAGMPHDAQTSSAPAAVEWAKWAAEWSLRVDTLEPITFEVRLGERSRLAISYLRSYASFGRALWWIDDGRERALQAYRQHLTMEILCEHVVVTCAAGSGWAAKMLCLNSLPTELAPCKSRAAGLERAAEPPHILNGRWEERSSQASTAGLLESTLREREVSLHPMAGVFRANVSLPLATRAGPLHNVSIAMLWPDYAHGAAQHVHAREIRVRQQQPSAPRTRCWWEGSASARAARTTSKPPSVPCFKACRASPRRSRRRCSPPLGRCARSCGRSQTTWPT